MLFKPYAQQFSWLLHHLDCRCKPSSICVARSTCHILQAHGVYEGTYWDLLGNLGELSEALNQMSVGPTVLEEPSLQLPPSPSLPSWDSFKPVLQPQPPLPQVRCGAVLCCAVLCCAGMRCAQLR